MANKDLQFGVHKINEIIKYDNVWWREEPNGIYVYFGIGRGHVILKWSHIRAALKRKDKK